MTGYMTRYRKSESKGENAYLIKFARTRARVRIKKRNLANIRKNDVKIIRIIVGQGKSREIFRPTIFALCVFR